MGGAYVGDICRTLTHKGSAQLSSGRLQENVWSKIRCNPPCPERSPWTKIPLRGMPQLISSKEMVKVHNLNVHLHRRWKCSECLKLFRWQCNLYKHRCRGNPLLKTFACKHCHKSYAHLSGLSRHKRDCKASKCDVEKDRKYQPEPRVTEEVMVRPFRRRHRSRRKWVVGEGVSSGPIPTLLATGHAAGGLVTSDDDSLTPTLVLAAQWPTIVCDGSSSEKGQPREGKKTMPLPTLLATHCIA